MKFENIPLTLPAWGKIPQLPASGVRGTALIRSVESGDIRMRLVEYSAGYEADHWCAKGHAAHLLSGSILLECPEGKFAELREGMSFLLGDAAEPHKVHSPEGALLFIVD